jgi:hypothetical protein
VYSSVSEVSYALNNKVLEENIYVWKWRTIAIAFEFISKFFFFDGLKIF